MRRWISPRGARRGFILASLATVAWLGWAVGYIQAASAASPRAVPHSAPAQPPPCCHQHADT